MKYLLKTILLLQLSFSTFAQPDPTFPPPGSNDDWHQDFCAVVPCHDSCASSQSYYCEEKSLEQSLEKPETKLVSSEFGDLQIVEIKTKSMDTVHYSYKSNTNDEIITAVLTVPNTVNLSNDLSKTLEGLNKPQSLVGHMFTINMKKGQIIFTNNTVSVLTSDGFSQMSLNEFHKNNSINEDLKLFIEQVTESSEFKEFNEIVSILGLEKGFGCALAQANLALAYIELALALGGAVYSAGAATPWVIAAMVHVTAGEIAVATECYSEQLF